LELGQHRVVDQDGPVIVWTTVNDTMTDSLQVASLCFTQPIADRLDRGRNIWHFFNLKSAIDERDAVSGFGAKPRACTDAIHLPLDQPFEVTSIARVIDLELDAG